VVPDQQFVLQGSVYLRLLRDESGHRNPL